jgi:hypothetical protein
MRLPCGNLQKHDGSAVDGTADATLCRRNHGGWRGRQQRDSSKVVEPMPRWIGRAYVSSSPGSSRATAHPTTPHRFLVTVYVLECAFTL